MNIKPRGKHTTAPPGDARQNGDTMPTTHHTTGPWYATKPGNPYQGLVIDERTGANIAVTYDKEYADLIASAPELLAALKIALECIEINVSEELSEPRLQCKAAIAKAEGRPTP